MTRRRGIAVLLSMAVTILAACGGDSADGEGCTSPAPTERVTPDLPPGFPTPDIVSYTGAEEAGPSTILEGFATDDLEATFQAYVDAFPEAGYDVLDQEKEERDAEVNFAGGGTSGQVRLFTTECAERTSFSITIRPD